MTQIGNTPAAIKVIEEALKPEHNLADAVQIVDRQEWHHKIDRRPIGSSAGTEIECAIFSKMQVYYDKLVAQGSL